MTFSEQLPRLRKSRGLSQEELAERLGVSRQAVSKWETGESVPDLPKLLALAEALETSLDVLCGREDTSAAAETRTAAAEPRPPAARKRRRVFAVLLAALALTLAFFAGRALAPAQPAASQEPDPPALPETLTVSGVDFSIDSAARQLRYRCVPSAYAEGLRWEISFTDIYSGQVNVQAAEWEGGVCTGLYPGGAGEFFVTLTVSNGRESRSVLLSEDVMASPKQNYVSWIPAEG